MTARVHEKFCDPCRPSVSWFGEPLVSQPWYGSDTWSTTDSWGPYDTSEWNGKPVKPREPKTDWTGGTWYPLDWY